MKQKLRWVAVAVLAALFLVFAALVYLPPLPANAPTVLVSVDRTVWNRLGLNRLTHVRALRDAGLRPIVVDFDVGKDAPITALELLGRVDGLVLGGGGDVEPSRYGSVFDAALAVNPIRDEFEFALLHAAEQLGLPVLGICRGAQLINVYRGGTLGDFRADSPRYEHHYRILSGHSVNLDARSRLASIFGDTRLNNVVTYHGQYVDTPGAGVRVVGYSPDGTPEAIEVETGSAFGMLGVQWHAEVVPWDVHQAKLFNALFEAAAEFRADQQSDDQ